MVYGGLSLVPGIVHGLDEILEQKGFASVGDAVGTERDDAGATKGEQTLSGREGGVLDGRKEQGIGRFLRGGNAGRERSKCG